MAKATVFSGPIDMTADDLRKYFPNGCAHHPGENEKIPINSSLFFRKHRHNNIEVACRACNVRNCQVKAN